MIPILVGLDILVLLMVVAVGVETIRAHRKHVEILTVIHSDIAHGLEAIRDKIEGRLKP